MMAAHADLDGEKGHKILGARPYLFLDMRVSPPSLVHDLRGLFLRMFFRCSSADETLASPGMFSTGLTFFHSLNGRFPLPPARVVLR
jgi:hypothetical protein